MSGTDPSGWSQADFERIRQLIKQIGSPQLLAIKRLADEMSRVAAPNLQAALTPALQAHASQHRRLSESLASIVSEQTQQRQAVVEQALRPLLEQHAQRTVVVQAAAAALSRQIADQQAAVRAIAQPLSAQIARGALGATGLQVQQNAVRQWMESLRLPLQDALKAMQAYPDLRLGISDDALRLADDLLQRGADEDGMEAAAQAVDEAAVEPHVEDPEFEHALAGLLAMLAEAVGPVDRALLVAFVYLIVFAKSVELWLVSGGAAGAVGILFGASCHSVALMSAKQAGRFYDRLAGEDAQQDS